MAKKSAKASTSATGSGSGSDSAAAPATTKATPTKTAVAAKRKSNSLLFVVVPVLVALAGGLYATFLLPPTDSSAHVVGTSSTPTNATTDDVAAVPAVEVATPEVDQIEAARIEQEIDEKYPPLWNKYESELVLMTTQKLLSAAPPARTCRAFEVVGDITSVEDAMAKTTEQLRDEGVVFLMLNGENDGVFVQWDVADACLRELALLAGEQLGADVDVLQNGVKLMTQMGLPITNAQQLDEDAARIAHVLLDFQIWVWPGVKVGHVFDVDGVTLKTLSMSPRVFGVEGFFTDDEAQEITLQGINRLERSPVDSPDAVDGYHSDRTSYTAFLKDNQFTRDFRARTAKLARLPSASFVERLQLVRYETGQFFRQHEDYFDSKKFVPVESIAEENYRQWTEWASTKIHELVDSGVEVPEQFHAGHHMHPNADDTVAFQHGILGAFVEDADAVDFFKEHADVACDVGLSMRGCGSDAVGVVSMNVFVGASARSANTSSDGKWAM